MNVRENKETESVLSNLKEYYVVIMGQIIIIIILRIVASPLSFTPHLLFIAYCDIERSSPPIIYPYVP
jgi:hypothetical protein